MSRQRKKHQYVVQVRKGYVEFRKILFKQGITMKPRCRKYFGLYKELWQHEEIQEGQHE